MAVSFHRVPGCGSDFFATLSNHRYSSRRKRSPPVEALCSGFSGQPGGDNQI